MSFRNSTFVTAAALGALLVAGGPSTASAGNGGYGGQPQYGNGGFHGSHPGYGMPRHHGQGGYGAAPMMGYMPYPAYGNARPSYAYGNPHGKDWSCGGNKKAGYLMKTGMNEAEKKDAAPAGDIVDVAVGAGSFNTLVAAVKAAELVETLKGEGPFTVFAPTDEAFAKIPKADLDALLADKEKLTAVLTYHVVPGKVMAADVVKLESAKTVEGESITIVVSDGGVKVDEAMVVKTDIETSNGVIHVIDTVLIPNQ